jgi:hypothetical protein
MMHGPVNVKFTAARKVSILLYNKLPERINSRYTFSSFKKELKSILLQNTFYTAAEYSQIAL